MSVKTGNYKDLEFKPAPGYAKAKGAGVRWITSTDDDCEHFFMRVVSVEKDGYIGTHSHPHEHQVFIIRGNVKATVDGESHALGEGEYIRVPSNAEHSFVNTGDDTVEFICVINNTDKS